MSMNMPELVNFRKLPERIYIRAGMWSKSEPSMNWASGEYERGTSVYPARFASDGSVELDVDDLEMIWHDYSEGLSDRLFWVVTGHEICKGNDGEPVLRCSSIVARPVAIAVSVHRELVQAEQ
jgi:hypothetical protein